MSVTMGVMPREAAGAQSLRAPALAFILVALAPVAVGSIFGPAQALNYANLDVYPTVPVASYYQGLTVHGVLNALVFTTFFNCGILFYLPARELGVPVKLGWVWAAFGVMILGLALTLSAILTDQASVLYTFYAPLKAAWPFYVGLALIVIGSLMVGAETIRQRAAWTRRNPGRVTPLIAHMSSVVWILWALTAIGLVAELLIWLIPWSLGARSGVDPVLTFTLFWYTGHPIVYFWLLPAYISWYALLPRQAGGYLVSDTMARVSFIMLLLFSIEVGLHHEVTALGIAMHWKMEQMAFTFMVIVPSLLTAFTVAASLETAGRGRGWFGWLGALPWRDPSVVGQVLAMFTFILGGATGIMLASMPNDVSVHDTVFVPGHFHLTVGTATALTFISISYWLVPHLTERKLYARSLAVVGTWLWAVGMTGIGIGLMWQGLEGTPRRDFISSLSPAPYLHPLPMAIMAAAGMVMLTALISFLIVTIGTLLSPRARPAEVPEIPFADYKIDETSRWVRLLDSLGLWAAVTFLIVAVVWGPVFGLLISHQIPIAPNTSYF